MKLHYKEGLCHDDTSRYTMYLQETLEELHHLFEHGASKEKIASLSLSPLIQEHELLQLLFALISKKELQRPYPFVLEPLTTGIVPLYKKGFFPWGAFPYPAEHAQLGFYLTQLGESTWLEVAHKMVSFQQATLDHNNHPLGSLFAQEGKSYHSILKKWNEAFFTALHITPPHCRSFVDKEYGIIAKTEADQTLVCLGSGCKSGMGIFLKGDCGVINFAPQLLPLGDCRGFGLAGRGQNLTLEEDGGQNKMAYICRVAAPHPRLSGFSHLEDAAFSGLWIEAELTGNFKSLSITIHFIGFTDFKECVFTFFGKGKSCLVAGTHRLQPGSFDRYKGPAQQIHLLGAEGEVFLTSPEGATQLEIIPLAGNESFWGADFLIAYSLSSPNISFELH